MSGQEVTEGIPKECSGIPSLRDADGDKYVYFLKNNGQNGSKEGWVTECISKLKEKADTQSLGERKVEQTIVGASTGVAGLGAGIATGVWIIPKLLKFFR